MHFVGKSRYLWPRLLLIVISILCNFSDTLLDPMLLDFLNNTEQLLFWACNVNSAEGYRVSQILRENTYPFIGVVGLSSNPG